MDEKNYKDLVIHFTRYIHSKSLKTLSMYYHGLMTKTEEHEGKKIFMVDDYLLGKIFDKIKEIIDIEKFDDAEILIDMDDKLPHYITLKMF